MAKMLSAQGIDKLDGMAFGEAVADVINGNKLQLTEEQMTEALKWRSEQARKMREENGGQGPGEVEDLPCRECQGSNRVSRYSTVECSTR